MDPWGRLHLGGTPAFHIDPCLFYCVCYLYAVIAMIADAWVNAVTNFSRHDVLLYFLHNEFLEGI